MKGVWNWMFFKVTSNPNPSGIYFTRDLLPFAWHKAKEAAVKGCEQHQRVTPMTQQSVFSIKLAFSIIHRAFPTLRGHFSSPTSQYRHRVNPTDCNSQKKFCSPKAQLQALKGGGETAFPKLLNFPPNAAEKGNAGAQGLTIKYP